jgi:hypothetical protein
MEAITLVLVVISALAVIAGGVWVAVALVHAICPPRGRAPARRSTPDGQDPSDGKSAVRVADKSAG